MRASPSRCRTRGCWSPVAELDRPARLDARDGALRPASPDQLPALLTDWEAFAHERDGLPLLVRNALLHYQLETIHPFLDGNGRLGRLMIVYPLVVSGRLPAPLLDISSYFERERQSYYAALPAKNAIALVDLACEAPVLTARLVKERLGVTRPTAGSLLRRLETEGVLERTTSGERGQQRYVAREVFEALVGEPDGRERGRMAA